MVTFSMLCTSSRCEILFGGWITSKLILLLQGTTGRSKLVFYLSSCSSPGDLIPYKVSLSIHKSSLMFTNLRHQGHWCDIRLPIIIQIYVVLVRSFFLIRSRKIAVHYRRYVKTVGVQTLVYSYFC